MASTALVTAFIAFAAPSARADDAAKFLKAMTDYTAAQKSISATFDSDIEVVTPELEKSSSRVPESCSSRDRTSYGSVEQAAMPTFS